VKNAREKLAARFGDTQIGGKGKHWPQDMRIHRKTPAHSPINLLKLIVSLFRHPEKKEEHKVGGWKAAEIDRKIDR
jgi:hypothetical protein